MKDHNALFAEDTVKVKILYIERASDLACAVVLNAGSAKTESAVCYIELMAVSPRSALRDFFSLVIYTATGKIVLYKLSDRTALYKRCEDFCLFTESCGNADNVCFGACRLHSECIAYMNGLTVCRGYSDTHAGRYHDRIFAILFEFHIKNLLKENYFIIPN